MDEKAGKKPRRRDPFWRLRRVLGAKRKEGAKSYRRQERRRAEREAERQAERDRE